MDAPPEHFLTFCTPEFAFAPSSIDRALPHRLACSPHFQRLHITLFAAANTMEQGDDQQWLLPADYEFDMNFDMDWSLPSEGNWGDR
jgi:hypothetical protein